MTPSRKTLGVILAMGCALAAEPVFATVFTVSGAGTWVGNLETIPTPGTSGTAVTEYSADGESMSFSFKIADTFSYTTMIDGYVVPTTAPATDLSDFSYTLGGHPVSTSLSPSLAPACSAAGVLCDVEFFTRTDQQGGALGLDFGDYTVEFSGADFGSTGTLVPGAYPVIMNIDYTTDGNNNVINEGATVVTVGVPEPTTWALMVLGVGAVGAALRRGARRPTAA